MTESEPLERAQRAIDEARDAAARALPGEDLPAPPAVADPEATDEPEESDLADTEDSNDDPDPDTDDSED